ncbi:MAG: glycosyltransferase family 2 protein [Chlorobi bacterium]|nr:glycosyltransferase family 2 protein [Chlorobiota bacterium]
MIENKSIAVVIPAYNEEKQIGMVLKTIPDFVDRIIVVDDGSADQTPQRVLEYRETLGKRELQELEKNQPQENLLYSKADHILAEEERNEIAFFPEADILQKAPDDRLILIKLKKNRGKGKATAWGYKWAKDHHISCTAVMDGDGQMDPSELYSICTPVISEGIDYVKGNRLRHRSARVIIPRNRFLGNSILSILTKIASGYWRVSDTQTAFTAISLEALQTLTLYNLYHGYGVPNDLLVKLNIAHCTLKEVNIKPVYKVGEESKMKPFKVVLPISWLLLRLFFKRLWVKYLFRDFHPLFILYHTSFVLLLVAIPYAIKILRLVILGIHANPVTVLAFVFLFISGSQSLLFAMWMDMLDNERLYK